MSVQFIDGEPVVTTERSWRAFYRTSQTQWRIIEVEPFTTLYDFDSPDEAVERARRCDVGRGHLVIEVRSESSIYHRGVQENVPDDAEDEPVS